MGFCMCFIYRMRPNLARPRTSWRVMWEATTRVRGFNNNNIAEIKGKDDDKNNDNHTRNAVSVPQIPTEDQKVEAISGGTALERELLKTTSPADLPERLRLELSRATPRTLARWRRKDYVRTVLERPVFASALALPDNATRPEVLIDDERKAIRFAIDITRASPKITGPCLVYFTDAALSPQRGMTGSAYARCNLTPGFQIPHPEWTTGYLGTRGSSIPRAEFLAIDLALANALVDAKRLSVQPWAFPQTAGWLRVIILTDSMKAIGLVGHFLSTNVLSSERVEVRLSSVEDSYGRKLARQVRALQQLNVCVQVRWVPGHISVPGNSIANKAAETAKYFIADMEWAATRSGIYDLQFKGPALRPKEKRTREKVGEDHTSYDRRRETKVKRSQAENEIRAIEFDEEKTLTRKIEEMEVEAEDALAAKIRKARTLAAIYKAARVKLVEAKEVMQELGRIEKAARQKAAGEKAAGKKAARKKAARIEAERIEAERIEAARIEAAKIEAALIEAAWIKSHAGLTAQARKELASMESLAAAVAAEKAARSREETVKELESGDWTV
ncbi:hypothetical protein GGS20DRAFT_547825 [Poronia punctata]|nr:hypothetical protein GGS20DRAFT_547825 [Poronia punctata]